MVKKFEKDELIVHSGVSGKRFKIIRQVNPSQYEILDMNTNQIFLEPIECLLDLIDSRDQLINFLLDEK
jgi:hypothetical protein